MVTLKLSFDEYIPLRDIVFKTLREAIITGALEPGERLMEIKLANQLGVSRTPVREAIRKLEAEGLVIMTARKGAEVAPINEKDLKDVLEIRKALDGLAVQLACRRMSKEDIKRLKEINASMAKAIKADELELAASCDVEFHKIISDMSKNDRLIELLHQLKEHVFRYRYTYIKDTKNKAAIIDEHSKIISDISEKNIKAAKRDMEHHIEVQEKYILNTLLNDKQK